MAVHGVSGYASGCRCAKCFQDQRDHEKKLAAAAAARWAAPTQRVQRAHDVRTRKARAAERYRQLYEQALRSGDYEWLLKEEKRALAAVRVRTARLTRQRSGSDKYWGLLVQQAQQRRKMAEQHHKELTDCLADAN